jgi:hypothetical protein
LNPAGHSSENRLKNKLEKELSSYAEQCAGNRLRHSGSGGGGSNNNTAAAASQAGQPARRAGFLRLSVDAAAPARAILESKFRAKGCLARSKSNA